MNRQSLIQKIRSSRSFLCVGLDSDISKIPTHLFTEEDPIFAFNKSIIDATREYAVAYKINTAFYEAQGVKGWLSLTKTVDYLPKDCLLIADAKRGDIGNTADQYAKAFFDTLPFDGITVAPYMGEDSITPFLQFKDKWAIVLALTSNDGSSDFQLQQSGAAGLLYERVLKTAAQWGTPEQLMFVVGATRTEQLANIRKLVPEHFLLVPGVGAQGGNLTEVAKAGLNDDIGLLVNVSRAIIFAGSGIDFASRAGKAAKSFQQKMTSFF